MMCSLGIRLQRGKRALVVGADCGSVLVGAEAKNESAKISRHPLSHRVANTVKWVSLLHIANRPDFHTDRKIPHNPYSQENFPSRLTCWIVPIFCCLAKGKLGAASPVFAKEFLAQNGLGTELLREVGVPKVGHHVFGIWF